MNWKTAFFLVVGLLLTTIAVGMDFLWTHRIKEVHTVTMRVEKLYFQLQGDCKRSDIYTRQSPPLEEWTRTIVDEDIK